MSEAPVIAQKAPFPVEVEAGKTYFWCACGKSSNQPFCDGSHKDTGLTPVKFEPAEDGKVFFCGCKQTSKGVRCDGTHNKL
ncbi:MAG: CDGSH iron-sulfur domain-containing protein [Pseudomonadota bacterium]